MKTYSISKMDDGSYDIDLVYDNMSTTISGVSYMQMRDIIVVLSRQGFVEANDEQIKE